MNRYRILFSLSGVLMFLCILMCFIVDLGSAEFYIMILSSIINLGLFIFSIIMIKKQKRKDGE